MVTPRRMEILGKASTKVTSVCHESARPPPLEASSSKSFVPCGAGTVGCATVRPKRAPNGLVFGVVQLRLAAEEQHLVLDQRGSAGVVERFRSAPPRQADEFSRSSTTDFAADGAGHAADAQFAEGFPMRLPRSLSRVAAFLAACTLLPAAVHAEGQLRIAEQFGIVYLLLNVAQDQKLVEKHGKAAGVDIKVEYVKLSGGSAVNDALLSGSIDIAGAGVGPLLTIWDRTLGKQNVRGVASLGNFPYYLVSNNPAVKTIADFTEKDRIALPAVGVSVQSRVLQFASAKLWGDAQFNRLDKLQVALPHPEATAAIIKGGTEITGTSATRRSRSRGWPATRTRTSC
jgi:hypothetical protein